MAGTRSGIWKRTISLSPDDVDFVEKPPRQLALECPICMGILFHPHIVSCCGYHFCETCLDRVKREGQPCPMCKGDFTSLLNKSLQRDINQLTIVCPNSKKTSEGPPCDWIGELGCIEDHLNIGKRFGGCQCLVVGCNYGCGYSNKRYLLVAHEQTECPKRPYSCDYCNEYESTCEDVIERHWPECKDYPVECPNQCQTRYLARGLLQEHLNSTCELQEVNCPFEWAGCTAKTQRVKLMDHLNSSVNVHVCMVGSSGRSMHEEVQSIKGTLGDMKKQKRLTDLIVSKLEREDEANKVAINALQEKMKQLCEKITTLEHENKDLKEQIGRVNSESKAEKEILARRSFSLESSIGLPPFLFVVEDFHKKLAEKKCYLSPPFYSHLGGYRFCIKVTPSGIFFGEGSHISLTVFLMKGVFDESLRWPFRGNVTVALIDRINGSENFIDTIKFDKGTSAKVTGRVTSGEMNESGLVSYLFVDLALLKPNSKQSPRFLPDNSLHIKVLSVTVAS
ncbi:PREDICTED: TNF receptor-associated factor 5-like [Amphimedon queenslandica]|uniref:RING-type E3 ubiquitin transferase n=1 Tax=Amphimedon queenslandica TaxID=400682 RepID=A0A1X7VVA0_AMPQE|nr:PREDICTED: TNF receptor-associated factor 5-like [Amphimedon queenslandica]|eukprot:XP_011403663.1 PREDICTED: TNF receptor-associated factor 5-like [Amphimedon queenslandica]